jgi:mannose-P-dolichol utilization defect protein 1
MACPGASPIVGAARQGPKIDLDQQRRLHGRAELSSTHHWHTGDMSDLSSCLSLLLSEPSAFLEGQCVALVTSKVIGYCVIAGSTLVKLPQILKICAAGSVEGISHASVLFEFVATLVNVSYFLPLGYPFSTWGENAFLLAQNAILYVMHAHYSGGADRGFALEAAACCAVGFLLYRRAVPDIHVPAAACDALLLKRRTISCEELAGTLPMVRSAQKQFCSRCLTETWAGHEGSAQQQLLRRGKQHTPNDIVFGARQPTPSYTSPHLFQAIVCALCR